MSGALRALVALALLAPAVAQAERRCGWFDNPTPGNLWLHDRDGEWTIAVQGMGGARGWDDFDYSPGEQVSTNRTYGLACGCLTGTTDRRARRVRTVTAFTPLPLRRCRADPALRGIERRLGGG